jgi:rhodanese-related sulfurtransferase
MFGSFFTANPADMDGVAFKNAFETTAGAVLLDVRTPSEYAGGCVPGAVNLDIMSADFQHKINALDKDKAYFVYCRSGNRSGQACQFMKSLGLKAFNLVGGIGAWPH